MRYIIGTPVQVKDGNGVDSGKTGFLVSLAEVQVDGRGVPTNVEGAYKPVDWKREVAIKVDVTGEIILAFKGHIKEI